MNDDVPKEKEVVDDEPVEPPSLFNHRISRMVSSAKAYFSVRTWREENAGCNCFYRKSAFACSVAEFY